MKNCTECQKFNYIYPRYLAGEKLLNIIGAAEVAFILGGLLLMHPSDHYKMPQMHSIGKITYITGCAAAIPTAALIFLSLKRTQKLLNTQLKHLISHK